MMMTIITTTTMMAMNDNDDEDEESEKEEDEEIEHLCSLDLGMRKTNLLPSHLNFSCRIQSVHS